MTLRHDLVCAGCREDYARGIWLAGFLQDRQRLPDAGHVRHWGASLWVSGGVAVWLPEVWYSESDTPARNLSSHEVQVGYTSTPTLLGMGPRAHGHALKCRIFAKSH